MRECSSCAQRNPDDVKRCVECGTPLDAPDAAPAASDSLEADLLPLIKEGRKIEAIKLCRERTGKGLKEAKELVDNLAAREGVQPAGCFPMLALILAVLAVVLLL